MHLSVICHDIRSVHNVGSIFRTADAAGAEKIYLCGITPSPRDRFGKIRPDFAKVALGAEKSVACESIKSTEEAIEKLKADGWTILALEQSKKSIPYDQVPIPHTLNPKTCLVLGAEVEGLPPSILALADHIIEIPMRGEKESLNVSVAFGIAIFEIVRNGAVDGCT
jgi:tRNA G18 (ribose-2'-O)-methylase SpoU